MSSTHPIRSAQYLLTGFRLMLKPRLRGFVLIPMIINICLFVGLFIVAISQFELAIDWFNNFLPDWLTWLSWLIWPLFIITLLFVFTQLFAIFGNLLIAPFNGLLSEKTERLLTGQSPNQSVNLKQIIVRSMVRELQKMWYFIPRASILLLLFLIPGINIFAAVFWFIFSAWMMAIQYLDYAYDNNNIDFKSMLKTLKEKRLNTMSFGLAVAVTTTLPFINFFVMPAAVVGATAFWVGQNTPR